MNATTRNDELMLSEKIALDTTDLMKVLSCGRATAIEIGTQAQARIQIGKRVLWNSNKVKLYLDSIATE